MVYELDSSPLVIVPPRAAVIVIFEENHVNVAAGPRREVNVTTGPRYV